VLKRLLVHAGGFNLGLWMRTLFGIGTPRGLQGRLAAAAMFGTLLSFVYEAIAPINRLTDRDTIDSTAERLRCV
jgi:hypothetical protein